MATIQDLTAFDAALKDFWIHPIRVAVSDATVLLSRFEKNTEQVSGREAVIVLIKGYLPTGSRAENQTLPSAGATPLDQTRIPMRYNYVTIKVSGPAIAASRDDMGAFADVLTVETERAIRSLTSDMNRQLFGDGSGILALVDDASPDTSLGVDSAGGIANDSNGAKYVKVGMRLSVYAPGGSKRTGTAVVTGIDEFTDPNIIYIDALPTGTADNDEIYNEDSKGTDMMGLYGLAAKDDNTVQNIDRTLSDNYFFRPMLLKSTTARPLDLDLLQQFEDRIEKYSGSRITAFYSDYNQRRHLIDLLQVDRRFTNEMLLELRGGYRHLEYNGLPFIVDKDCQENLIYGLDESVFKIYTMIPGLVDWIADSSGAVIRVARDGTDAYEMILACYANLGCSDARASGAILNLED